MTLFETFEYWYIGGKSSRLSIRRYSARLSRIIVKDRLGPNGKVSKKRVHLSMWTTLFVWTGPIEIDRSI